MIGRGGRNKEGGKNDCYRHSTGSCVTTFIALLERDLVFRENTYSVPCAEPKVVDVLLSVKFLASYHRTRGKV